MANEVFSLEAAESYIKRFTNVVTFGKNVSKELGSAETVFFFFKTLKNTSHLVEAQFSGLGSVSFALSVSNNITDSTVSVLTSSTKTLTDSSSLFLADSLEPDDTSSVYVGISLNSAGLVTTTYQVTSSSRAIVTGVEIEAPNTGLIEFPLNQGYLLGRPLFQETDVLNAFRKWDIDYQYAAEDPVFFGVRLYYANPGNLPAIGESPVDAPSKWIELASVELPETDVSKGVKTPQVFNDQSLVIGTVSTEELRKNKLDVGYKYPSEVSRVYHLDENYLDQNGLNELEIAIPDTPEETPFFVERDSTVLGITTIPAIDFKPLLEKPAFLYGNFSIKQSITLGLSNAIDFYIKFPNITTMLDESLISIVLDTGEHLDVFIDSTNPNRNLSVRTVLDASIIVDTMGDNSNPIQDSWGHMSVEITGTTFRVVFRGRELTINRQTTSSSSFNSQIIINPSQKLVCVDELLIDPSTSIPLDRYQIIGQQSLPWAANENSESWLVVAAKDPYKVSSNAFVNKHGKQDTVHTTVVSNDERGFVVETTMDDPSTPQVGASVPTASSEAINEINEKYAVNRQYLQENIKLSKEGAGDLEDWNKIAMISTPTLGNSLSTASWYVNMRDNFICGSNSASTGGTYTSSAKQSQCYINTADYNFAYLTENTTENNTTCSLQCCDAEGNLTDITVPGLELYESSRMCLGAFHPEFRENNPKYKNYLYAYSARTGIIACFDGKRFVGYVGEGNSYIADGERAYINMEMRGPKNHPILVLLSGSGLNGFVIGVNEFGTYDPLYIRSFTVDKRAYYSWNMSSGSDNVYLPELDSNELGCIRSDGTYEKIPLKLSDGTDALVGSRLAGTTSTFLELDNGDVVYIGVSQAAITSNRDLVGQGFFYIEDSTSNATLYNFETYKYFYTTGGLADGSAFFPMLEVDDYIFYFPTAHQGQTSTTIYSLPDSPISTHCQRLDKSTKEVVSIELPWPLGYDFAGMNSRVKTEGGYWWIFPCHINNATVRTSPLVFVIAPDGSTQTVDLGTEATARWCSAGTWNASSSDSSLSLGGDNIAVTKNGVGIALDMVSQKILLFKGNGEFKVYDYTDNTNLNPLRYKPTANIGLNNGNYGLMPLGNGAIFLSTLNTPLGALSFTYIQLKPNNSLEEPTYRRIRATDECSLLSARLLRYPRYLSSCDYEKRSKVSHDDWFKTYACWDAGRDTWGKFYSLKSLSNDKTEVYLKDGDKVFTSTVKEEQNGVYYKYDGKGNAKVIGEPN